MSFVFIRVMPAYVLSFIDRMPEKGLPFNEERLESRFLALLGMTTRVVCAGCQRERVTLSGYATLTRPTIYNNARLPGKKIKTLDPRLQMSGMTE